MSKMSKVPMGDGRSNVGEVLSSCDAGVMRKGDIGESLLRTAPKLCDRENGAWCSWVGMSMLIS